MEKRACGNFRDWEIWSAISGSVDARTLCRDPGMGGILQKGVSEDSTGLERRDSVDNWYCRMDFCQVPLPQ